LGASWNSSEQWEAMQHFELTKHKRKDFYTEGTENTEGTEKRIERSRCHRLFLYLLYFLYFIYLLKKKAGRGALSAGRMMP
jgi:hypothetical protein